MNKEELIKLLNEVPELRLPLQKSTQSVKGWLFRFPAELDEIILKEMNIEFQSPDIYTVYYDQKPMLIIYQPFRKDDRGNDVFGEDPNQLPTFTMPRILRG